MPMSPELPFGMSIDFSFWNTVLNWPSGELIKAIFVIIGWTILVLVFFYMGAELWVTFRQLKFMKSWKWVLLAIDIPLDEIQSPKAVEQIFAHLSGAFLPPNVGEKYWQGVKQKWFSLEIVSIEGYIQFLIYTEAQYRDLVEAAVYAQYPTAEITEVEDYVDNIPSRYPNNEYDVHGLEFGLVAEEAYPIRTYTEFEHSVTKDFMFNDPIAAILENFTRIGAGENFWFQLIIKPTDNSWKEKGIELVKKIVAQKKPARKDNILAKLISLLVLLVSELWDAVSGPVEKEIKKPVEPPAGKVSDLTPGLKDTVAAVEEKIAKVGFKTKLRVLYAARKNVFNPSKCLGGFVGAINQFNYAGRNALLPKISTKAYYAFKDYRTAEKKRKFVFGFKQRRIKVGRSPYILNTEELATLWHFPLPLVKTPLLQKIMTKRGEPPINLPFESFESHLLKKKTEAELPAEPPAPPPPELQYG